MFNARILCWGLAFLSVIYPSFNFNSLSAQPPLAQEAAPVAIELARVLDGLSNPVYVTNAHDNSNRLFIIEQGGRI